MKTCMPFLMLILLLSLASCHHIDDIFDHIKDKEDKGESFKTDEINAVHLFLADKNGDTPTDPQDLVYENRKMNPVIAPDGHHLTLKEFDAVKGKLTMECTSIGTRISMDLKGLIPFATYTVWVVIFEEPGFTPDFAHRIAEGTPGANEGFRSSIIAGSDGKATYSDIMPEGEMSVFGSVTDCLLDEYEVHVIGAYHLDGKTYGGEPGPEGTWVEQFGWMYRQE